MKESNSYPVQYVQRRAKLVFKGKNAKFNFLKHRLHLVHHTEQANRDTNQAGECVLNVFSSMEAKVGTKQAEDLEECYFTCC